LSAVQQALAAVVENRSLDSSLAERAVGEILDGDAADALVGALLAALRLKGETEDELAGAVRAMLARARRLDLGTRDLLDTSGTGGDGAGTFNISTGAALVAAAAGVPVAKAGNRAASGKVGGADVLERAGVRIDLDPCGLARCLEHAGICFIFAPAYHPALVRLAPLRRALGVRTLFNLVGPLCNAALPRRRFIGVSDPAFLSRVAGVAALIGSEHAMIVNSRDGLDEISIAAPTRVAEVRRGASIREYEIAPDGFGIARAAARDALIVDDPSRALDVLTSALSGADGAAGDALALNGGAAIYVGGRARSIAEGVDAARAVLRSGAALATLDRLVRASRAEAPSEARS
jgi:anthranilate phosphoribosyltransferase